MRTLSQLTTSRPLPISFDPSSMKDTECAEYNKKNNKHFSDFYFSSYRENFIENCGAECWRHKNDHNSKNKIGKNLKFLFFFRFSTFRIFHVNLNNFEKKMCSKMFEHFLRHFFLVGGFAPHHKASGVWDFVLGLVGASRNRLVSTAY